MTELRAGLVAASPGTIAVYGCLPRREWTCRAVLAFQWGEEPDYWAGWAERVGSELGLSAVDYMAEPGWTYRGLSHRDDWDSLVEEMRQTGLDEAVLVMTPVEKEKES